MRSLGLLFYGLAAAVCFASAFPGRRAASSSMTTPASSAALSSDPGANPALRPRGVDSTRSGIDRRSTNGFRSMRDDPIAVKPPSSPPPLSATAGDDDGYGGCGESEDERAVDDESSNDSTVATLLSSSRETTPSVESVDSDPSGDRRKRRKQIAAGLAASIAVTVGFAKTGLLGTYSDGMIAQDAIVTGLASVLAVVFNWSIAWGLEAGYYDSKTGRKLTHIGSAPLYIILWPIFSEAGGARYFAGLVTLTNIFRLYLAGTGDAAESSLANTISRSGDKSEVLGGPFIYVCLFQVFILAFWRDSFPGVVAMTTMAAGDGMADIIGRRYGRNGYKWPLGDGQKSLVGTVAFAVSAFAVTLGVCCWLIATGALSSSLTLVALATRILAISCICALVEILPIGDDNYTVPGSAALLSALWLR